jgi:alkylhydroperoxidase family enzyme
LLEQERGAEFRGEEFVAGVLGDLEKSTLSEKEKALFRFVDKVNSNSPAILPADMVPLYEVGWDDEAIYYAITVCALFNFYNRWIDASGVHALSDEAHRQNAKRSASAGYVRK